MNNKNHILVIFIFINFFIFFYGLYNQLRINIGESILYSISKPFLLLNHYISKTSKEIKLNLQTRIELKKEIGKLIEENRNLKEQLKTFKLTENENKSLKKFLSLDNTFAFDKIFAHVIGGSNSLFQSIVIIDKGKNDNLKNGLGVINYDGVVGMIITTFTSSAKVLLVTDPRFKVDVKLLSSNQHGILIGNNDSCIVKYLPINKDYFTGELVVTSGFNNIFPEGIPVGYVEKVINKNLYKVAIIKPFLKKYSLDFVAVLK